MRPAEARAEYARHADEPRHVDLTTLCVYLALLMAAGLVAWLFAALTVRVLHV